MNLSLNKFKWSWDKWLVLWFTRVARNYFVKFLFYFKYLLLRSQQYFICLDMFPLKRVTYLISVNTLKTINRKLTISLPNVKPWKAMSVFKTNIFLSKLSKKYVPTWIHMQKCPKTMSRKKNSWNNLYCWININLNTNLNKSLKREWSYVNITEKGVYAFSTTGFIINRIKHFCDLQAHLTIYLIQKLTANDFPLKTNIIPIANWRGQG